MQAQDEVSSSWQHKAPRKSGRDRSPKVNGKSTARHRCAAALSRPQGGADTLSAAAPATTEERPDRAPPSLPCQGQLALEVCHG